VIYEKPCFSRIFTTSPFLLSEAEEEQWNALAARLIESSRTYITNTPIGAPIGAHSGKADSQIIYNTN